MNRNIFLVLAIAALAALIGLTFAQPARMVSPGRLQPAHAQLATDCFACHLPWRGVSEARCISCHTVADIGRKTSHGILIMPPAAGFHQQLAGANCLGCHSDHQGPRPKQTFTHALLAPAVQHQCASCHVAPATPLHRKAGPLCSSCHTTKAWTPATFDHARYFALTGEHDVPCATCHIGQNYQRYTCFGCHEHTPTNIRAEHDDMSAAKLENCVLCHRSADEHGEGDGRAERRERDRKDDE